MDLPIDKLVGTEVRVSNLFISPTVSNRPTKLIGLDLKIEL
jgi:hypothetical protein